jgi:hypothetical protein
MTHSGKCGGSSLRKMTIRLPVNGWSAHCSMGLSLPRNRLPAPFSGRDARIILLHLARRWAPARSTNSRGIAGMSIRRMPSCAGALSND